MVVGIVLIGIEFPTIDKHLIDTGSYLRSVQTNGTTRQDDRRFVQRANRRCATFQLQVDIHHMQFISHLDITIITILVVGVLIYHRDNLFLGQIADVTLTVHKECCGLSRLLSLNGKVLLMVYQVLIVTLINPITDTYRIVSLLMCFKTVVGR